MKIIKKGEFKPEYPKEITCKKCSSILSYVKKDIKDNTDPRDNIADYWVSCPVCKNQISVKL